MAYTDWMIRTKQIGTCSCDYGCPCEFNAPPTNPTCEGVMAIEITEGHYGDVNLDGLRIAGAYHWPGPVHEGNGTWWSVVDKRATEDQVNALFTILGGQDQEPTTGFAIYASTIANEPDPVFADIDFDWDYENATGSFKVDGVLEATVEPIKNPVTGAPHRCSIKLRDGFEFREGEMVSANLRSSGEVDLSHEGSYGTIFFASYGPNGIIEKESTPHRNA